MRFSRGGFVLNVSELSAHPGEVLTVTGSSGAGKTTLLALLSGLVATDAGTVTLDGTPVRGRDGAPHPGIAVALAARALVGSLTVGENLRLALQVRGLGPQSAKNSKGLQSPDSPEGTDRVAHALTRLDVGDLIDRRLGELSGGQVQRVSVARALVVEATVLLLDEPTSELDGASRELTLTALREEADRGATVVMSTHDTEDMSCDARIHLDEGKVVVHP